MHNSWRRLLPFAILFLQIFLPIADARIQDGSRSKSTLSGDGTLRVAEEQLRDGGNDRRGIEAEGAEQVDTALAYLHRFEQSNPRFIRKPSGILGTVGQYLWAILPKVNTEGPAPDGSTAKQHKDLPKFVSGAVQLLEEAARVNNSDAIYLLAQMNFYGNFTYPQNYSEAFRRYQQLAALNGNSSAQHMIGFMYATGIGGAVEQNQAKALLYHTIAARGGSVRSEMTLAFRYHSGIGTPRSCDLAMKHYKNVATRAIEWFRSGPPGGMAWVPDAYRLADENGGVYGEGASFTSAGRNANKASVSSDTHAALDDVLEYLDLMSRKGDFTATFSLGRIYYNGQKGLPQNFKTAKWYFMKIAQLYWQKDGRVVENEKLGLEKVATKAAGYLGRMFLRGEGVHRSYEKAQIWFQRGIKSGDAGSQYEMGLMYFEGLGVEKNTVRATELFKAAATQDYAPAMVSLGALYLDQGTPKDIEVATRYFELAGRYGNIESLYYLAELTGQGIGRDRSCGLATIYYKTIAEKAEPLLSSFSEANQAYEDGDYELALVDYLHAAEQGYEKGQSNVAYLLDLQKSKWALPSWLSFTKPRPSFLQNTALALIYWTRSAKQSNIDSMVKMGDYYLFGTGTTPDMEKAASCYQAASGFDQSAQALYNLGWMHENGIGLEQDFHLAKRLYDQALETNDEAYLPVKLSLLKLRLRSAWNTLTNGRINSIQDEPEVKKRWSLGEWITNFLRDDASYYGDEYGEYGDNLLSENSPMPGGDADGYYEDIFEDGLLESLIIVGLAATLVFLIYYRQQQQLANRRPEGPQAGDEHRAPGQDQQQNRGLFPQPGDPEFGQWVAGGVGH